MSFLQNELEYRELMPLLTLNDGTPVVPGTWRKRRDELLEILYVNSYGRTPAAPKSVRATLDKEDQKAYANKAIQRDYTLTFDTPKGDFSFPFHVFLPKEVERPPVFMHINFRPDLPDKYSPVEEIIDNGFAFVTFCYHDICKDSLHGTFDQGLCGMFREEGAERKPDEWGKIGAWAYGCSRVMDWLIQENEVDIAHVAIVGHSRLGKTALWTAAQDERFFMACSNDSGFGGAAIHKKGTGERVWMFKKAGSWDWFCEKYKEYDGVEDENTTYDQHMLLACIAPRRICVGSAELDNGADPKSEFLNCYAQTEVYELMGLNGLVTEDKYPEIGTHLDEGMISYHIRKGTHFFSRTDWLHYMAYFKRALK